MVILHQQRLHLFDPEYAIIRVFASFRDAEAFVQSNPPAQDWRHETVIFAAEIGRELNLNYVDRFPGAIVICQE